MRGKRSQGTGLKAQSKAAVQASISFPPDLYETLEEIAKQRKCRRRGLCPTQRKDTSQREALKRLGIGQVKDKCRDVAVPQGANSSSSIKAMRTGRSYGTSHDWRQLSDIRRRVALWRKGARGSCPTGITAVK